MIATDRKEQQARGKIQTAKERLLGKYYFHAAALGCMELTEYKSVGTMGVTLVSKDGDGKVLLLFNSEFVLSITLGELVGVILHEIHHVLFKHLLMTEKTYPNKAALTIAQEVTVNEHIVEPLPKGVVLLKDYPQLPPLESTHERYQRLKNDIPYAKITMTLDNHGVWQGTIQGENLSPEEKEKILEEFLQDVTQKAGKIPPNLEYALEQHGNEPGFIRERVEKGQGSIDWRRELRRYLGTLLDNRPQYNRPNRRFPDLLGIVPGNSRQSARPKVMCVIDTSGSITPKCLKMINGELTRLVKQSKDVLVVECDTFVHRTYPFKKLDYVIGRGGTDLRPPLEKGFLKAHLPDIVIYFTDGFGPAPEKVPIVPVIWAILPDGQVPAKWGKVVKIS